MAEPTTAKNGKHTAHVAAVKIAPTEPNLSKNLRFIFYLLFSAKPQIQQLSLGMSYGNPNSKIPSPPALKGKGLRYLLLRAFRTASTGGTFMKRPASSL